MRGGSIGGALLVSVMSLTVAVFSEENIPAMEEDSGIKRQSCDTLVKSESIVIVNCSYLDSHHIGGPSIANIDNRVTSLDLSHSKLIKIPGFLQQQNNFANLIYLNLSHNEMGQHDDLKNMQIKSVRHLDFSKNRLTKFPACFQGLLTLNLEMNYITEVDINRDVLACGKLRHLSLAGNVIDKFSSTCDVSNTHHLNLEVLDLSSNKIKQFDNCAFDSLKQLLHLNLSHNQINYLSDSIFKSLGMLEKLDLSHNDIEYIESGCIEIMKDLKFLDLSHNKLRTLPNALPMMDWFDASFNRIATLPETFSSVLYPQSVFLLGGNPFICNCDLLWLKEFFDTRKYLLKFLPTVSSTKFIPVCESPETLKGASWVTMPLLRSPDIHIQELDSLDNLVFECSGLEDEEKKLIKENVEQVLAGKDLIEAAEIGENFVLLQWNIPQDLSKSVELSYHKFGQKKERKEMVLPSSVTSYKLKKLDSGTPYVICLKVTLTNELNDCTEIVTKVRKDVEWQSQILNAITEILRMLYSRYDVVLLLVGLISVIYFFILREKDASK